MQIQLPRTFAWRFSRISPGGRLLNHTGSVCLTALEIARLFSEGAEPFCFPPAIKGVPVTPHPRQHRRCQVVLFRSFHALPFSFGKHAAIVAAKFELVQGWALCGPWCWSFCRVPAHPMPIPTRFLARLPACDLSV